MKTYILFPDNLELETHSLLSSDDNFLKATNDISLNKLDFIESKDKLIYLLPSTLVSSHTFIQNEKLSHSNNLANFISEEKMMSKEKYCSYLMYLCLILSPRHMDKHKTTL